MGKLLAKYKWLAMAPEQHCEYALEQQQKTIKYQTLDVRTQTCNGNVPGMLWNSTVNANTETIHNQTLYGRTETCNDNYPGMLWKSITNAQFAIDMFRACSGNG
jgi:hypothetical protein